MSTDLKTVRDHPATILDKFATNVYNDGTEQKHMMTVAANFLRGHEDEHGITFAALDNGALEMLREAYDMDVDWSASRSNDPTAAVFAQHRALLEAIEALFGLGDD